MRTIGLVCFVLVLQTVVIAAEPSATVRSCDHWVGSWEISPEFNKLLGFDGKGKHEYAVFDHPISFTLAIDKTIGETLPPQSLKDLRAIVSDRLGHHIIATGRWETKFETDPGIDIHCIVTEKEGATFLWVGAPYAVIYGGKVSLLQGVDRARDVLVIDFNSLPRPHDSDQRSYDTVGFVRSGE